MRLFGQKRGDNSQRGSATLEVALLLGFVLLPLLAGVVNYGTYMNERHTISRAALQGSLAASRDQDAVAKVSTYLQQAGLDPGKAIVSVTSTSANPTMGDEMTVTIIYDSSGGILTNFLPGLNTLQASATTRHM